MERFRNPMRVYAFLEGGIGLFALVFPYLLKGIGLLYVAAVRQLDVPSFVFLSATRFGLPLMLLLVPTVLMGGTLPALCKIVIIHRNRMGSGISILYGLNTLGACVGAAATGFVLVQALGFIKAGLLAVLVNLVVAGTLLVLSRGRAVAHGIEGDGQVDREEQAGCDKPAPRHRSARKDRRPRRRLPFHVVSPSLVLIVMAASGFSALGYEVVWTRALTFFIGSTTYAFSTMLATFLFGLMLGSLVVARVSDRMRNLLLLLGGIEYIIGLTALVSIPVLSRLFYQLFPESVPALLLSAGVKFVYAFAVMILPTFFLGAALPVAAKVYSMIRDLRAGFGPARSVGDVYAANTFGCIAGSLLTGFLFIPHLGIQKSLVLLVVIHFVLGLLLVALSLRRRAPSATDDRQKVGGALPWRLRIRWVVVPVLCLAAALSLLMLPLRERAFSALLRYGIPGESIYYREGLSSIIEVTRRPDRTKDLYIDGGLNASTNALQIRVHALLAELPLLLHESSDNLLLVGLGSGITAGAATLFSDSLLVDCVEISNDVVQAAEIFEDVNQGILTSPQFSLTIEDGRNFLLRTSKTYDVIVTGIIHPKYNAGNAGLYGMDYYDLCRRRLAPGGILCQWAPLNLLSEEEYRMILKTFLRAFPYVSLWFEQAFGRGGSVNTLLIGAPGPVDIDYDRLRERIQRVESISSLSGIETPLDVLQCYIAGEEVLAQYADSGAGEVITDDRPLLEFGSVVNEYPKTLTSLSAIRERVASVLKFPTGDSLERGREAEQSLVVRELDRHFDAVGILIEGDLKYLAGDIVGAARLYEEALTLLPDNRMIRTELSDQKVILGSLRYRRGDSEEAVAELEEAIRLWPENGLAHYTLGCIYQESRRLEEAISSYQRAIAIDSTDYNAYRNLGYLFAQSGDEAGALEMYREALRIQPGDEVINRYIRELKNP
jgi:spermidine synthase